MIRRRAACLLAVAVLMCSGCLPPRSFKAVKQPRRGRPLGQLCLVYSQRYQIEMAGLERLHPFDINKYSRIYLALMTDGIVEPSDMFVPEVVAHSDVRRVHTSRYLASLEDPRALASYLEFGPIALAPAGFTDNTILEPFRYATGGTVLAARLALAHGMAINLGGGYHHAGPDEGGGFCIYADMPIAIRCLQAEGLIRKALVIDLDVHQGNGTALAFQDDETVYTFDMHQGDIYPLPKERNDLDVALPAGTADDAYLSVLADHLPGVLDRSDPDIIFFQAGVDVLEGDPLADFRVSAEGVVQRDAMVFKEADHRGIPIVMLLGGGYSERAWAVQYAGIRSLVERYGLLRGDRAGRKATVKEKVYTK